MTDLATSEVLNLAADSLERDGWQGGGPYTTGRCASNTIVKVSGVGFSPAHEALCLYLVGDRDADVRVIFDWNDAPERTADEVIATLRSCALLEAAKENTEAREPVTS